MPSALMPRPRRRPARLFVPERLESRIQLSLAPAAAEVRFDPADVHLSEMDVSMDADGDFLATWETDVLGDGPGAPSFMWPEVQRYDRSGNAIGAVIRPDDLALRPGDASGQVAQGHWGYLPSIATDDAGNFIVAWMAGSGDPEHVASHVLARRYGADGQPLGPVFRVDPPTSHILGQSEAVDVAMNARGDCVITWLDQPNGVFAQRYDAAGQAVGSAVLVDGPGGTARHFVRAAIDNNGRFAVLWMQFVNSIDPSRHVFVRHFGVIPQAAGPAQLVNLGSGSTEGAASLAMDADGDTLVGFPVTGSGLWAQRYSAGGARVGDRILLAPTTTDSGLINGEIAMEDNGEFVATWAEQGLQAGASRGSLRQFTATGQPVGDVVLVSHDDDPGHFGATQVAVSGADGSRALVIWKSEGPVGSQFTGQPYADKPGGDTGGSNQPPTTTGLADVVVDAGTPASVVPLGGSFIDDRDASTLTYAVRDDTNPGLFSTVAVNSVTRMLTLMYAPGQSGEATLTVTATDSGGLSVAAPLKVTVRPAAPAPDPIANPGGVPPLPAGTKIVMGRLFTRAPGSRRKVAAAGVAVFLDANANGTRDANEPAATSAASGFYAFTGLATGKYQVRLADAAWQPAARAGKPPRPIIVPARRRKAVMARPMLLAAAAP